MFISTGSFIIRGKRNFITPQRLELGFTVMFCLHEESLAGHLGERKPRGLEEISQDAEQPVLDRSMSNASEKSLLIVSNEVGEDEDIKIVQVGEKPREYVPADKKMDKKQQSQKNE